MATVIGVGMQMTANASGMTKGLSDADKALQLLQKIVDQNQKSLQRFTGEADKTTQQLDKLTKGVSTLSTIEIGRVLVDTFQALGSAFTSAAQNVLTLAGNVSSSLDSLNDLSARTGIGVESLQGYALAAKMAGVDTEAFGVAVQKLAVNIGKATPGDAMDKALRGINLSVAELRMLAPEQQFSVIGDAIAQLPTVAERAAVAVQVFGKQGAALAPLFREGAASIDELRERAERLGIIVSETQINNVADMNDAFDLVSATINGIIGQVIGNLAPAVTDVTNQFLRFVEEWSGAQGEGGTGIANRITEVLLQGAEIFAGVFDQFVGNFSGFTAAITGASEVFQFVANAFTAVTESLRTVFNLFETIGNGIMLAIGKLLEEVGAWVSDDLAQFGADLANEASAAMAQNQKEFLEAGANSFQAGLNAVGLGEGETSAAERGKGAATAYVQKFREQVEASQQPEIKVATNLETTEERLKQFLTTATDGGSEFLRQSVETLDTFQRMAAEGGLTADQIKIMDGFMENVNAELTKEVNLRQEAADAAAQQATADDKRIESLLKTGDATSKLQEDLTAVERQLDVLADKTDAEAQTRRDKLLTLRDELKGQQQAVEQGFGQGFAKAFEDTDRAIQQAIEKAGEFGAAGSAAAVDLAAGIEAAKALVKDGILDREAFELEVARQQQFFQQRVEQEQVVAREREAAAHRVEGFMRGQLDERQRAELDAAAKLEERKKEAALNVKAIEDQIAKEREAVEAARKSGNLADARAGVTRLNQLNQAKRAEQQIANGRAQNERQQLRQIQQGNTPAQQFQSLIARNNDLFLSGIQNAYAGANAALAQSAQFASQQAERVRRFEEMSRPTNAAVQTADFRTAEGQALVQSVAEQAQDPALIEARLQTKQLNAIAKGITQAAANYFNSPVAIVGGAVMG
jgi:phage tail tube protein FII